MKIKYKTSILLVEIWKAEVTQIPHENFEPHQLKDPNLALYLGWKRLNFIL